MTLRAGKGRFLGGCQGYLLLEVLLALVILSSGLILISRSLGSSISGLSVSKAHARAVLVLEKELAEIESGMIRIPVSSDVVMEGEEAGCRWLIRSRRPRERLDPEVPYTEVEVTVSWTEKNKIREVRASLGITP